MKRIFLSSYARRCAIVLFASVMTTCAVGQKTEADIKERLIQSALYLRGQWDQDKLEFDETGQLQGKAGKVSFTLSGVNIQSVKVGANELELDGQRVGIEFTRNVPRRVDLRVGLANQATPETMTIRIKAPANGDYTTALNAIFADSIVDLVPAMPGFWQHFARHSILPPLASPDAGTPPSSPAEGMTSGAGAPPKPSRRFSSPILIKMVEAKVSPWARSLNYAGFTTVNMVVGEDGLPRDLKILRPIGLGLDEEAVAAVSKYIFRPANEGGKPVPAELNIEVNFQIF